jgi:hypothetical protein
VYTNGSVKNFHGLRDFYYLVKHLNNPSYWKKGWESVGKDGKRKERKNIED